MKIGVDLDNVLFQFQPFWADVYEEWFGRKVDRKKLNTWDSLITETHFDDMHSFLVWFGRAGGWDRMPYTPGGPGAIDQLIADGHSITFVTSRSDTAVAPTQRWHQASPWRDQSVLRVSAGVKSHVPCSVYIDDSPYVIEHLLEVGKRVIVFDCPWNKGVLMDDGELGRRAKDWHEVLEIIKQMEGSE